MEQTHNVAGLDVHKKMLVAMVGQAGQDPKQWQGRKFGTTRQELAQLIAWLQEQQVREVAMESTAQYGKPVWLALEPHFQLHLAQARSTKAPKGRKNDWRDAIRIVKRLLADDLTLSFVPDADQRTWRLLTRTRQQLVRDKVRLRNHLEGLLEEGQIKLSSKVSDLLGASGRRILQALSEGETDPVKLAALADERVHASQAELVDALSGHLTPPYQKVLARALERVALLERHMKALEEELSQLLQSHQEAITRLCEIPGVCVEAAHQIVAELGPEAAAFPSAGQAASWVGVCPGDQETAGESQSSRCAKGNRQMRRTLDQTAWAAVRTKGSYFQELYHRLMPRLGVQKAIWAVAHRILKVIWKILHEKVHYIERGARGLDAKAIRRRKQNLVRGLRRLGYAVELTPLPAASRG